MALDAAGWPPYTLSPRSQRSHPLHLVFSTLVPTPPTSMSNQVDDPGITSTSSCSRRTSRPLHCHCPASCVSHPLHCCPAHLAGIQPTSCVSWTGHPQCVSWASCLHCVHPSHFAATVLPTSHEACPQCALCESQRPKETVGICIELGYSLRSNTSLIVRLLSPILSCKQHIRR